MKKTRYPGVTRLPDGRMRIRATALCRQTGKMRDAIRTFHVGVSQEEAVVALAALKQELREGRRVARPRQSVTDYAEQWLERKAARLGPSVAVHYERVLGVFILPRLGGLPIEQVTRDDVERWIAWAERASMDDGRPYARDTIMGWWRVMRAMLRDAAAELNLRVDPTYRVQPPKPRPIRRREMRTLTAAELEALLANLKQYCPERYAEAFLLAYTGMRAGELFALKWEDIDEAAGRIHIRRSVWKQHVSETKTNAPREVALPKDMIDVLREHHGRMGAAQHVGLASGLVFPANTGGHRTAQSLYKPLALAAEAAGIEVKVAAQVLRRTFNTLMLEVGVDRIVLRSQMGHSSEEMTQRYAGVSVEAKQRAVGRLLELTGASSGEVR